MEDFLQKIWHAKTWFIATLILTYCLSGISSSLSEIRKTAKNQLDHSILLDDTGPEQKLQLKIIDLYKESHTDLGPILLYYKSLENKEHINKEEQNTGRNYAAKTVEKLRINYASSAGIRLACSECRSLHKELLSGMSLTTEVAIGFSDFFENPNSKNAKLKLSNIYNENLNKNYSIASTVIPAFSRQLKIEIIEIEKNIVDLHHLNFIAYEILIYALYILAFTITAIWKYTQFKLKNTRTTNQKLLP